MSLIRRKEGTKENGNHFFHKRFHERKKGMKKFMSSR
jgi:hypothetical protein